MINSCQLNKLRGWVLINIVPEKQPALNHVLSGRSVTWRQVSGNVAWISHFLGQLRIWSFEENKRSFCCPHSSQSKFLHRAVHRGVHPPPWYAGHTFLESSFVGLLPVCRLHRLSPPWLSDHCSPTFSFPSIHHLWISCDLVLPEFDLDSIYIKLCFVLDQPSPHSCSALAALWEVKGKKMSEATVNFLPGSRGFL